MRPGGDIPGRVCPRSGGPIISIMDNDRGRRRVPVSQSHATARSMTHRFGPNRDRARDLVLPLRL